MKTFAHDHTLARLPIPQLPSTCSAISELVAPLVDASTLVVTKKALEDFIRPGGDGERLQEALQAWSKTLAGNASWLRPFWDDMYTSWRGSLPVGMNYYLEFSAERWGNEVALPRFVRGVCHIFHTLGRGDLDPEPARNGFQAMDQLRKCVFTRIPDDVNDTLVPVQLTGPLAAAVVCKGHWFSLPLQSENGTLASEESLAAAFASIRAQAAQMPAAYAVSAMTAAPRPEAASLRREVQATTVNRLNLAVLEKTLFVVCLDDAHTSPEDLGLRLLGGDAACRWFDKSLQIIATENGGLGANFEHAGCDAGIWVFLLTKVDEAIMGGEVPAGETGKAMRALVWDISESVAGNLGAARAGFAAHVANLDLACNTFPSLSRDVIKSLSCSPDAFLQVAFQVAQWRVFGTMRSGYEAVAMRGFAEGRTECARPSTADALAFAKALHENKNNDTLRDLFRQAERAHLARLVRCQRGIAVERHMYGLQTMFALHGASLGITEAPALFTDAGWKMLKYDALSTSGIGGAFILHFGFCPVVEDGFGVGYGTSKDETNVAVTSFRSGGYKAQQFVVEFLSAAESLVTLLQSK